MLTTGQRGAGAPAAPTKRSRLYRAIIAKRPDTEDAYRKLALVYWRAERPAAGDRNAGDGAAERRHAERSAHQAGAVPGGVRPAGEGDRAAREGRRRRSRRADRARQCLHVAGRLRGRGPDVHAAARRSIPNNALALREHRRRAAAGEGLQGRGSLAAQRRAARSEPAPAPTRRSAWCSRPPAGKRKPSRPGSAPPPSATTRTPPTTYDAIQRLAFGAERTPTASRASAAPSRRAWSRTSSSFGLPPPGPRERDGVLRRQAVRDDLQRSARAPRHRPASAGARRWPG